MPNEFVDVWRQAHEDFRAAAVAAPWDNPTLLPGWTVGDIVAHTVWIERTALNRFDPPHTPDFDRLPHATTEFGRISEVPVDLRRSRSREEVLAELDETVADRYRVLLQTDAGATASNIFGQERPIGDVLRDRIFDLWVHEQDIRVPAGDPGHLSTTAARVAAGVLIGGLGYVWAKRAGAPIGASLAVQTTAPGLELAAAVQRDDDGRARPVPVPQSPTVVLTMTFADFVALTCGRSNADPSAVLIEGDERLGSSVVAQLAVTP